MRVDMRTRLFLPVALGFYLLAPVSLRAQSLLSPTATPSQAGPQLGGKFTVDLVTISPNSLGLTLRHGSMVPSSEQVSYNGRKLQPGQDYTVDNDSGEIYLLVPSKPGDTVSVSYRYNPTAPQTATATPVSNLLPFNLDLGGGSSLGVTLGMGMAERAADGSVTTSNVLGWNNSFSLGGASKMNGLMLFGQKSQDQARSQFEYQANTIAPDQGKSRLILQSLAGNLSGGTFQLDFQDVSKNFSGFSAVQSNGYDASVANQLQKEKGLKRMGMNFSNLKFGALGLSDSYKTVGDELGGITWQTYGLNVGGLSLNYQSQVVGQKFDRFADIAEADRAQLAKEAGLSRSAWNGTFKSGLGLLAFDTSNIDSSTGEMSATDASLKGKTWSFDHIERNVASGFTALPNLTQKEIDGDIGAISNMYVAGGAAVKPEDRTAFLQSPGLSRDFTRLSYKPSATWSLGFDTLGLKGKSGGGQVNDITLAGKGLNVTYRQQDISSKFTELATMMPFEQQKLGLLAGLERTDFNLNANMPGKSKLALAQTAATDAGAGGFKRQSLSFTNSAMQVSVNSRKVAPNFTVAGQMLDTEAGLLASLVGFQETDAQIKWQINKALHLEAQTWNGTNPTLAQKKATSNMLVDWNPNKATSMEYQSSHGNSNLPGDTTFAAMIEKLSITQNFGKAGTLKLLQQDVGYDGIQATTQPDTKQTDISYEAKLNPTTSVKTEQIQTTYDNGDKEDVSANTINTEITKQAGIQMTDISIDRKGTANDERKRNVGFWLSLWHGVRLNFGVNDDLANNGATTTQHTMSLSPGTIGDWQVGSATYNANSWDQTNRIQAASTVSLNTVKPFKLGFFNNVKMSIGQATSADNGAWLKNNKNMSFTGNIGKNAIGYAYNSQMTAAQIQGIDRALTFTTDQTATNKLRASALYKMRTVPGQPDVAVRNLSLTARPVKGLEVTNEVSTNPEIPRSDVLLGTLPQPMRVNKWKIDYLGNANLKISGSWAEQRDDSTGALSRLSGVTFTMFEKSGSPLSIFLGNQMANDNLPEHIATRWSLRWDQKPGPNQVLSMFLGNVTYQGTISPGDRQHNMSIDFEYQFRFGGPKHTTPEDPS